jgi:hypothetical protein
MVARGNKHVDSLGLFPLVNRARADKQGAPNKLVKAAIEHANHGWTRYN